MTYVLDTNILLLDAHNLYTIGVKESTIVIPEKVLDEIDSKKSGLNEIAYQAREFGRLMTSAEYTGTVKGPTGTVFVNYLVMGRNIVVVSPIRYPDFSTTEINIINDRKIIYTAMEYKSNVAPDEQLLFITNDVACGIRAQSLGLVTDQLREVSQADIKFKQELTLADDSFRVIHGKDITNFYDGHKPNLFNYIITNESTGQVKLATVKNNIVNVLGKESEVELRKQQVVPKNAGQLFLSRAVQDQTVPLVIVEALSGSGKTLMALSNAIKLVKVNSPYTSIIYVRGSINDVDPVEEVGFLKGSAEEKNEVYFHPLLDSLNFIAKRKLRNSKMKGKQLEKAIEENVEKIIEDCDIQMLTGLGMRGRTFENAVVIIDEAQNFSKSSLRKILTRFGKDCKVVVIGSNKQIDNAYVTKYTNGLSVLLEAATQEQSIAIHVVPLTKVVRSNFAEFAELLFETK